MGATRVRTCRSAALSDAAAPISAADADADAASSSPTSALRPLTDADLQRHIDAHGLKAQLLPRPADLPDGDVIKSLVFTANGQPLLVVAPLSSKVDERRLAAHLGVSRRRVRLASTADALVHSGYAVGTVPPFGEPLFGVWGAVGKKGESRASWGRRRWVLV